MESKYNAIHFDMDGVIADTEALHVAAEQQTCVDYDFDIDTSNWGGFKGRTAVDIFNHLIDVYGNPLVHKPEELIAHKTKLLIESLGTGLVAIDGVMDFLQWAREAHPYMSLVTSSDRVTQQFITQSLGINELFDVMINGDDITEGKPCPQPYLRAMGRLGIVGRESIVIEDSTSGILSALRANCDVLAITTSHSRDELTEVSPTYIADTYLEARSHLEVK